VQSNERFKYIGLRQVYGTSRRLKPSTPFRVHPAIPGLAMTPELRKLLSEGVRNDQSVRRYMKFRIVPYCLCTISHLLIYAALSHRSPADSGCSIMVFPLVENPTDAFTNSRARLSVLRFAVKPGLLPCWIVLPRFHDGIQSSIRK